MKEKQGFLEKHIDEIMKYANEDCSAELANPCIVDTPTGEKQESDCELFTHEWIDQHCGCCEDDYYGTICFPLPSGKYFKITVML